MSAASDYPAPDRVVKKARGNRARPDRGRLRAASTQRFRYGVVYYIRGEVLRGVAVAHGRRPYYRRNRLW